MKNAAHLVAPTAVLLGLPLAGIWMTGHDVSPYLEFPPRTQYVVHAPFSWPAFIILALVILGVITPFLYRIAKSPALMKEDAAHDYPWWGWLALFFGLLFWVLAWTRFSGFAPLQRYTFAPQWICYIVAINALTWRRSGHCLLTHHTRFFLKLFPLSAAFWWFFEYLNRFVQNWYYVECEFFTPFQYFIAATLPFSTVLPAVLSTEEWLAAHPRCSTGLKGIGQIKCSKPKTVAWITLFFSTAGLFFIGRFPNQLFPLLWIAPVLLLLALNALKGQPSFYPEVYSMDFRRVFRFALAALVCGFFWEMWNYHSLAKWIYAVPYVHCLQLFEMPILGYAGYLPFGLECAVIAAMLRRRPIR